MADWDVASSKSEDPWSVQNEVASHPGPARPPLPAGLTRPQVPQPPRYYPGPKPSEELSAAQRIGQDVMVGALGLKGAYEVPEAIPGKAGEYARATREELKSTLKPKIIERIQERVTPGSRALPPPKAATPKDTGAQEDIYQKQYPDDATLRRSAVVKDANLARYLKSKGMTKELFDELGTDADKWKVLLKDASKQYQSDYRFTSKFRERLGEIRKSLPD